MSNRAYLDRRPISLLTILLLVTVLSCLGTDVARAAGVLSSNGDTSYTALEARRLKDFPTLESIVPMPQNINPGNRKRVREFCGVQVYDGRDPLAGAKLRFRTRLTVMDNTTQTFRSVSVASGRVVSDEAGLAFFSSQIPTELFADGFKSGDRSAWSHTRVDFTRGKGTYTLLSCDLKAKK